jgi:teichuronic acid biosynthesis glycosyltransferase TuaG
MNISIIITTFNAEKFIVETLESIRNQTYTKFEIVIIDDGSTDNTTTIIQEYALNYTHLNLIIHKRTHLGRASSLMEGVIEAKNDWLAIIDADDLWHKQKLEIQVHYIKKLNLQILATNSVIFKTSKEIQASKNSSLMLIEKFPQQIRYNEMLMFNKISHSSILMHKDLAKYNINRKAQIDYELFLRILYSNNKIYTLKEQLVYHRVHDGQSFEAKKSLRYALSATKLQLYFCFKSFKLKEAFFVILKIGYYFLLPRNLRLSLRAAFINKE